MPAVRHGPAPFTPPRRRAASLVELLVVIGVVALLIALLIPAVTRARTAGLRAACGANLHGVAVALATYAADHRGQLPVSYSSVGPAARPGVWLPPLVVPWRGGLALLFRWPAGTTEPPGVAGRAYLGSARGLTCPGEAADPAVRRLPVGLFTPADRATASPWLLGNASYVYGYVAAPAEAAGNPELAGFAGFERYALTQRGDAARRSILAEQSLLDGPGLARPGESFAWFHGPGESFAWFHGPGGNVLYADGHAAWVPADAVRPTAKPGYRIAVRWRAMVAALDR